jgi:hypothetical protein
MRDNPIKLKRLNKFASNSLMLHYSFLDHNKVKVKRNILYIKLGLSWDSKDLFSFIGLSLGSQRDQFNFNLVTFPLSPLSTYVP